MARIKVIFFSWDTFYGKAIRYATGSKWTHVGIAFDYGKEWIVYEALNKGLVKSIYTSDDIEWFQHTGKVTIKEVKIEMSKLAAQSIAEKYVGAPYDWLSIFNIAWFTLFGKKALNFGGPRQLICSEFVARVLYEATNGRVNFEKELGIPYDMVTPADLFRSELLK